MENFEAADDKSNEYEEEKYDPYDIMKNLFNQRIDNNTVVYFNKHYPLFIDFLLWKNQTNKEEKYQIEYYKIKDKITNELSNKKFSELSEAEKNVYLLQFKYYINNIYNIKNKEVKEMEKLHNDKSIQIKELQEKINKKSMLDMELDNGLKDLEERKIQKKIEMKEKLESFKRKLVGYKDKMKKSEEIINNYENSVGNEDTISIMNIVSGLRLENQRLNNMCEEQELEIASLDRKRKELEKDIELLEKTPNKINNY